MKHRKLLIAPLAIALLIGAASAYVFVISNTITQIRDVRRTDLIKITVTGFPGNPIKLGINYTFTVLTENLADEELSGLTTYITIQYKDAAGDPVPLKSSWFFIYYKDSTWEGEIQDTFAYVWGDKHYLVSTALGGGWTAPKGYSNTATVWFRISALAPLPDPVEGTVTWSTWVEASTL